MTDDGMFTTSIMNFRVPSCASLDSSTLGLFFLHSDSTYVLLEFNIALETPPFLYTCTILYNNFIPDEPPWSMAGAAGAHQSLMKFSPCDPPRQAKGLDLSFPLLCDYSGATAKAYGAYLELEEQGEDELDQ